MVLFPPPEAFSKKTRSPFCNPNCSAASITASLEKAERGLSGTSPLVSSIASTFFCRARALFSFLICFLSERSTERSLSISLSLIFISCCLLISRAALSRSRSSLPLMAARAASFSLKPAFSSST